MRDLIESRTIVRADVHYRVNVVADADTQPDDIEDWASSADKTLWWEDSWRYVGVIVTRLHQCAECPTLHDSADSTSLWGVQYGRGDGWSIDTDYLINVDPVPDLITELTKGK